MASRRRKSVVDSDDVEISSDVSFWLAEIEAAKKREKDYRAEGRKARELYAGRKKDDAPFNILFSNTETMLPAMYSQVPRPVVTYRYKDDPTGKAAAEAAKKYLEFALDTNIDGYETFHESLKGSVLDALLPGRGVASVKFEADDYGEMVCTSQESWDRIYFGYARKWSRVPWIAYERHVDQEEAKKLFPESVARIQFVKGEDADSDSEDGKKQPSDRNTGQRKTACVYQIWDRDGGRKVRWVSPQYKEGYLKVDDDPLELTGFFNTPRPLQFIDKTDDMVPVALYALYENQAKELNEITRRLNRLIKACKARGVYDAALGDIANVMEAEENDLVPSEEGQALEKGLDKAIWFMPLDKIIQTIRELYVAREQVKQVIYEIMGISDILRGATKASETLGAQQIKSTWGSLRLKPKQAEVQRYARDIMRMMIEIAASKVSQETWAKVTGLPYFTDQQMQATQQMVAQMQQAAAAGDPQAMQQLQQAQQQLQGVVKWSDVLGLLQDDLQRAFRIDIETNSTVEPEAAEDQKAVTELMTAIGQFVQGIGPLVERGVMPFQVAQSMLLAIAKRFRFGGEIEDQLRGMQPPAPEGDGGEKAKADADAKLQKAEITAKEREAQLQSQLRQAQEQIQSMQREMQLAARENKLALDQIDFNAQREAFKLEQKDAQREMEKRTVVENTKIDAKKKETALEQRVAKSEQGVAKAVDVKTAEQASKVQQIVGELTKTVQEQFQRIAELERAVKAPRRKTAKRGPDGKISEVIEEVMQ